MPEHMVTSRLMVERARLAQARECQEDFISKLSVNGRLRMAGRFNDGKGGINIIEASRHDEPKEVADADPYHKDGFREYGLRERERQFQCRPA
jgi:uncharacterized protein YciI